MPAATPLLLLAAVAGLSPCLPEAGPRCARRLTGHSGAVLGVGYSQDGALLSSSGTDGTLRVWNASSGEEVSTFACGAAVVGASLSADAEMAVVAEGSRLLMWDTDRQAGPAYSIEVDSPPSSVDFAPDGLHFAASSGSNVSVYSAADGRVVYSKPSAERTGGTVRSIAYSPDGLLLAAGSSGGTVRLWGAGMAQAAVYAAPGDAAVADMAFFPDGVRLAVACGRAVRVVDVVTGADTGVVLQGHVGRVNSVAFSPDGVRLVTASQDGTARVWGSDGTPLFAVQEPGNFTVNGASFSPDGLRIATVSADTADSTGITEWSVAVGDMPDTDAPSVAKSEEGGFETLHLVLVLVGCAVVVIFVVAANILMKRRQANQKPSFSGGGHPLVNNVDDDGWGKI